MKVKIDYIIVGQGIAGTVLAHTLIKADCSILIIDNPLLSQASRVAAGLYNPVVFKRLVKSWMADELIPYLDRFYLGSEKLLNTKFYHKKKIVKLFAEDNEKEFWLKKANEEVGKYLSKDIGDDFLSEILINPMGSSEVLEAGNLDTRLFLNSSHDYFISKELLLEEEFDHDKVQIPEDHVEYKGYQAKKIIFCEGFRSTINPWFNWLPFKLTKGEIITIKLKEPDLIPDEMVINKGVFILPLGEGVYKVGSTYEWNELNEEITEKGKSELISKLKKILKVDFEVINHEAGIRPTVNDRRPILGLHPAHPQLAVFNGLGTKGVMLAPYFADQLVKFLENGDALNNEVSITRFQ
ncbi:MAG: dependent oxidoreductase [Bacteroidota bacterium]|jgi:glycine/D-amino acid oxidase-like deaminating enzyme|nr:dependent oxidoreductase [Bacteroidota bacterium]